MLQRNTETALATARVRQHPRVMMRRGYDLELNFSESMLDMEALQDIVNSPYKEFPTLYNLQRYTSNQNGDAFKEQTEGERFRAWPEVESIEGVAIAMLPYRVKRESVEYLEDEPNPIICASPNAMVGVGVPGGLCKVCEFADWDLAKSQGLRKPTCDDRIRIFVKTAERAMPVIIDLNGGHRRGWLQYTRELVNMGAEPWMVVSNFQLRLANHRSGMVSNIVAEINGYLDTENEDLVASIYQAGHAMHLMAMEEALYQIYGAEALEPGFDPDTRQEPGSQSASSSSATVTLDSEIVEEEPPTAAAEPPELEEEMSTLSDMIARYQARRGPENHRND